MKKETLAVSQWVEAADYLKDYMKHTLWTENAEKVCDDEENICGKIAIVTGGNTGIGKMTVLELAKRNAVVIMAVRDLQRGQAASDDIKKLVGHDTTIDIMKLDLGDLQSVRAFVKEFESKYSHLNILVNNAGFMDTNGALLKTKDGFERHMGVNHLGPFLLTRLLMNSLKVRAPSRVICVASSNILIGTLDFDDFMMEKEVKTGHFGKEPYSISKLANAICMKKFATELEDNTNVKILQLCPGYVKSDVFRYEKGYVNSVLNTVSLAAGGLTPHQGCETIVYLATSKSLSKPDKPGRGEIYRFLKFWERGSKILADYIASEEAKMLYEISENLVGLK